MKHASRALSWIPAFLLLLVFCLSGGAEPQNNVSLTLPALKPGQSGKFTAHDERDRGAGVVTQGKEGLYRFSLQSKGASGRYAKLAAGGEIKRTGVGFDNLIALRSFISNNYFTTATTASHTCPSKPFAYNWLGVRFRSSDAFVSPMDAASANYPVGGSFEYKPGGPAIAGNGFFDLSTGRLSTQRYSYSPIKNDRCADASVKVSSDNAVRPLQQYGTLFFGNSSLAWISSGGNPFVALGTAKASLAGWKNFTGLSVGGLYTEFLSRKEQTQKNIVLEPEAEGLAFAIREITNLDDASSLQTRGRLECAQLDVPSAGFCSGSLTLEGVSGSGKAICLPYQHKGIACAAQSPSNSHVFVSILAFSSEAMTIATTAPSPGSPRNGNATAKTALPN